MFRPADSPGPRLTIALRKWRSSGSAQTRWLVAVLVVFTASTLVWDWQYRHGQPFDIDESGYLNISLLDFRGLATGGLLGWIHQVEAPSFQAPLTTALTTPMYLLFGPRPLVGLLVPLVFSLITIAGTFGLARRTAGSSGALAAAILVASTPVIIDYSRDYHFASAATALTVVALYCLDRSDGMLTRRWAAAFGVAIGLMPLARTMTIAFLPGFVVAVALMVVTRGDRLQRLGNALLSAVLAVGVAALWLGVNGNGVAVWNYLTGYGYGPVSSEYGTSHPLFSYGAWLTTAQVLARYLLLPHLLLLATGGFVLSAATVRLLVVDARRHHAAPTRALREIAVSPLLPLVSVVGLGLVALTSSANQGSAFSAPLVPPMCVLAVCALRIAFRSVRWPVATATAVVATIAAVPSLPIPWALTGTWAMSIPQLGPVAFSSGQGVIQQYVQAGGPADTHRDAGATAMGRQWVQVNAATAQRLQSQYGVRALVAMGFRHRLYNVNSINLAQLASGSSQLPLLMVPRETTADSPAGYREWLHSGTAKTACLLLTAQGVTGEFSPPVTNGPMVSAATAEGFRPIATWPLPDSRVVTEWQRSRLCPG